MGNRRPLRQAFFKAHPRCCFCGGDEEAVQEDHIPARSLFRQREWPVGYVFPACGGCNRESALDELAMGWLVRITISDPDPQGEREMARALVQLHAKRPDWVAGMKELSRVETRRHMRERGLSLESFKGYDVGVVTMPPELLAVPERYGQKLGKALYYLHTERIVPRSGEVRVSVYPNADFMAKAFPRDSFGILTSRPVISRSGKALEEQFCYRYATVTEGGGAGFLVQFGESLAMVLLVVEDAAAYAERRAARAG